MSSPDPCPRSHDRLLLDRFYTEQRAILGEASTMIAHEVNQPLTAIRTYAESGRRWLARSSPDVEEALSAMEQIIAAAEGVAAIVKRIRGVLQGPQHTMTPLVLDDLIRQIANTCRRELKGAGVQLLVRTGARGRSILGDPMLLEQSILNLIGNAVDALLDAGTPSARVWVTTTLDLDSVVVTVRDNGPGFTEAMRKTAFEPFTSSRPERLGLGLSICRSTALAHDGEIQLRNGAAEQGALVRLALPLTVQVAPSPDEGATA